MEFVTASHNETVYRENLRSSLLFDYVPPIVKRGYSNISKAYNEVKPEGLVCYLHHDLYLPPEFLTQVINGIKRLPKDWGVIGVAGVKLIKGRKENYGNILDRGKTWAYNLDSLPAEVDTLDELLLITHGDLTFDENLDLDFYGADICMQAKEQGRKCYVINAFVSHNSKRLFGGRSESFYRCQEYFKTKWAHKLPIVTTCSLLT